MIHYREKPPQHQKFQPCRQAEITSAPIDISDDYHACGKLSGKDAIVTGGDSGIGGSVAIHFTTKGADLAIVYLNEDRDAAESRQRVEDIGRKCLKTRADVGYERFCREAVRSAVEEFGKDTALGRAAKRTEVAPCYVFIASEDASHINGQVLHPNGGSIANA